MTRPRRDWGAVRLSTSPEQLRARLLVVDAVGDPDPRYIGRHRADRCTCHAAGNAHRLGCQLVTDAIKQVASLGVPASSLRSGRR